MSAVQKFIFLPFSLMKCFLQTNLYAEIENISKEYVSYGVPVKNINAVSTELTFDTLMKDIHTRQYISTQVFQVLSSRSFLFSRTYFKIEPLNNSK